MQQVKELKTHVERVRDVQINQMVHACQLLEISGEQYCWHQYKQYELFLALACREHLVFRDKLRYSTTFRVFWNNEWANRNQVDFFPFAYESKYDKAEITAEYKHIHSADRLFSDDKFYYRFECILKIIRREE